MNRRWMVAVTLIVTALLVAYAFWGVDLPALLRLLADGDYRVLLPFTACLVLFYWVNALRWVLLLRPLGRYRLAQVTPAMMIGFGGNNVLPVRLGELLRAVVFAMQHGRSRSGVLATVVLERVLDVFAILVLYLGAVLTLEQVSPAMQRGLWLSAAVLAAVALAILVFLRFPHRFAAGWHRWSRPLPARLQALGQRFLAGTEAGLSSLRSPGAVAALAVLSVVRWAPMGAMVWLSLYGYGTIVPLGVGFLVIAVAAVAVTLPSVPGFFGVIQAAFVAALTPFGVSREVALAASVLFLLAQWVPVTLAGLAFFLTTGLDATRVRRAVEESA